MVDTRFAVSVHILTSLACAKGERVTSPELAESVRTNPIVVRRLVARLVEKGLVTSYRGKAGGLSLARPAETITLRDVYLAATEKRLLAVSDKPSKKSCPVSCAMKEILGAVVDGMEEASLAFLEKTRLSDLAARVPRR